ncbi:hypothetical protein FA95DRAFT_1560357, partial [Auriscalpium vulgare]
MSFTPIAITFDGTLSLTGAGADAAHVIVPGLTEPIGLGNICLVDGWQAKLVEGGFYIPGRVLSILSGLVFVLAILTFSARIW